MIRIEQNKQGCTYLPGFTVDPPLTPDGLGAALASRPGGLWIVGNEPDRGPNPESCTVGAQDDTQPDVYAQAYHDIYSFIKLRDPSARVANAGLVEVTPGRLQYLDKVWAAYQQLYKTAWPVDVWNMHLYILPEVLEVKDENGHVVGLIPSGMAGVAVGTDLNLGIRESNNDPKRCSDPQVYCFAEHDDMNEFSKQVVAMRTWMKTHGQQNKPLILSEYSLLYPYIIDAPGQCYLADELGNCFTPTRVRDFMNRSLDYLGSAADPNLGYPRDGNRLVQRWLWFSIYNNGVGSASSLLDNSQQSLSLPGQNFQARAGADARTLNLYPAGTTGTTLPFAGPSQTVTATLTASIRNAGTSDTTGKVYVNFYADAALSQLIGRAVAADTLRGCEGNTSRVEVKWPGQAQGTRDYWVVVDPENLWAESNEGDNIIKGTLFVGSAWSFLPHVVR